jgi:hypothetical protein
MFHLHVYFIGSAANSVCSCCVIILVLMWLLHFVCAAKTNIVQ